jgi:hypothetical protein
VADHRGERVAVVVDEPAPECLKPGDVCERPAQRGGIGAGVARQEPVAAALEDVEVADGLRNLGHELDGAGAGADDRDALAGEVIVVVPLGGVEGPALEVAGALDAGEGGAMLLSGRDDHGVGVPLAAVLGADRPAPVAVVPADVADLDTELGDAIDAVGVRDALDVAQDLALRGTQPRPVPPLRVRVGVEVAWHVAGGARVGVVEPGAAQLGGPVDQRQVPEAVSLQLDRGSDAAEAATDDHDVWVSRGDR